MLMLSHSENEEIVIYHGDRLPQRISDLSCNLDPRVVHYYLKEVISDEQRQGERGVNRQRQRFKEINEEQRVTRRTSERQRQLQ